MKIVLLGLSITSSWGNGHATTYRGLVRELVRRGHEVVFLERDQPWYAEYRDLPNPPFGETHLYTSLRDLRSRFGRQVREADLVMVGSFVPEGVTVGSWVADEAGGLTAFYDIDTPITLAKLAEGDCAYLSPELIPRYQLYLSFTGGPTLARIESLYGAPLTRPLYCAVDPDLYYPDSCAPKKWKLGYLGTYSEDRQPALERLLLAPARLDPALEMVVAGSLYPEAVQWPETVERIAHLSPANHRAFYNAQDFTLNITRAEMIRAGYSPSVRLFEAAACGTPIMSDTWPGLETFFTPGEEILLAGSTAEMLAILREMPASTALALGRRARDRVLASHTAAHRAAELEALIVEASSPARRAENTLEYSPTL